MTTSPETLVPLTRRYLLRAPSAIDSCNPDAVFIPFLADKRLMLRHDYIRHMAARTKVVLIASDSHAVDALPELLRMCCEVLILDSFAFMQDYKTPKHTFSAASTSNWDLDAKRNLAVLTARARGYARIILHDSDITCSWEGICHITGALNEFSLAGPAIDNFPDTSVLGHCQRLSGDAEQSFVTGALLGINVHKATPFFPCIYNEDWLAIFPYLCLGEVALLGSALQDPFDPFSACRSRHEEFGEIIAEGVMDCVKPFARVDDLTREFWEQTILRRRQEIDRLLVAELGDNVNLCLYAMREQSMLIKPEHCLSFIDAWMADVSTFKRQQKE